MIHKHSFNMIEVVLALMVISIGVMSIMGLIPIGTKAHKDAMHLNHAADAADEVLHYIGFVVEKGGGLPSATKPSPDIDHDITNGNWSLVDSAKEGDYFYRNTSTPSVYRIQREHQVKDKETNAAVRNIVELDATVVVWYSNVTGMYRDSAGLVQQGSLPKTKRLNVEISWPGVVAYSERQKEIYSLEVTIP